MDISQHVSNGFKLLDELLSNEDPLILILCYLNIFELTKLALITTSRDFRLRIFSWPELWRLSFSEQHLHIQDITKSGIEASSRKFYHDHETISSLLTSIEMKDMFMKHRIAIGLSNLDIAKWTQMERISGHVLERQEGHSGVVLRDSG